MEKEETAAELPDIYEGELNSKRIATYTKQSELYDAPVSTISEVFCAGADWYKSIARPEYERVKKERDELREAVTTIIKSQDVWDMIVLRCGEPAANKLTLLTNP